MKTAQKNKAYPAPTAHIHGAVESKGERPVSKKRKLNYRFVDPNPEGVYANAVLTVFTTASEAKAEAAVRAAMGVAEEQASA